MLQSAFFIEEWTENHPRYSEFLNSLEQTAPDQREFVVGDYSRAHPCHLFVALQANAVVGFLRISVQPIGPEANCPPLYLKGELLTEAKIHAFAVREESRNQGIGTALQRAAIQKARALGCYQVSSYSLYEKTANHQVKLALGFAAQPEVHGDTIQGVYFIMPLRIPE